jgi:hypothetical protein
MLTISPGRNGQKNPGIGKYFHKRKIGTPTRKLDPPGSFIHTGKWQGKIRIIFHKKRDLLD